MLVVSSFFNDSSIGVYESSSWAAFKPYCRDYFFSLLSMYRQTVTQSCWKLIHKHCHSSWLRIRDQFFDTDVQITLHYRYIDFWRDVSCLSTEMMDCVALSWFLIALEGACSVDVEKVRWCTQQGRSSISYIRNELPVYLLLSLPRCFYCLQRALFDFVTGNGRATTCQDQRKLNHICVCGCPFFSIRLHLKPRLLCILCILPLAVWACWLVMAAHRQFNAYVLELPQAFSIQELGPWKNSEVPNKTWTRSRSRWG